MLHENSIDQRKTVTTKLKRKNTTIFTELCHHHTYNYTLRVIKN